MKYRTFAGLAASVLLMLGPTAATAVPINWSITGIGNPGQFVFDADTGEFSSVFIFGSALDQYFELDGNANGFEGVGAFIGDLLSVSLDSAMTNSGGLITGTYVETNFLGDFLSDGPIELFAIGVSIPEPTILALLGLGLAGMGLGRRSPS